MFYILDFIVFRSQCVFYQHSTFQCRLVTCQGLKSHKHQGLLFWTGQTEKLCHNCNQVL